ncbi:MAG TPA: family 16 glycoside hydrolase [Candidatus Dormibacteraeota bacterium]|nr:family 16 glycoside hydrolase [Candidatus Dormibacteraeota bacterium]
MQRHTFLALLLASLSFTLASRAEVKVTIDHNPNESASGAFKFKNVPAPSKTDAATDAKFAIVDGQQDDNGGSVDKLHDGKVPTEEDQPTENFFFDAGSVGGSLAVDIGSAQSLKQVNTYSWHPNTRGPQLYTLYGSDGKADGFDAKPKARVDPEKAGWKLIAKVDTRPKSGEAGGQYGVSISNSEGALGKYRYLLFVMHRTETDDDFGNTFYSEIDVVTDGTNQSTASSGEPAADAYVIQTTDGKCRITIDTSGAPDLKDWAEHKLGPMLAEWYPKMAAMLPSEGYEPPKAFSVTIRPGDGVAATGGTRITANSTWLKHELDREGLGALLHEEVHVLQQYRRPRRDNPDAPRTRTPGWLVEGIPDYIRWFIYEPQSHGADITWMRGRRNLSLNYDARYRITANFLDYVINHYDKDKTLLAKVNAACRDGNYKDEFWKDQTGKPLAELNDEWKTSVEAQLGRDKNSGSVATQGVSSAEASLNTLSQADKAAGWKLLFDGKDLEGWHSFKRQDVRPGWQLTNGVLSCVDPHNAGDLCTKDQYDWFELQLDYNISEAGNSGIMFHVTDDGGAAWATGPEFQLEDNAKAADPQRCGWLYGLYKPPTNSETGQILDATKPPGEWNHIRLLVTPQKCEHDINGVKYFEYVLNSDDFKERVSKTKFAKMPLFAKFDKGYIALQGDHGQVSFRNIKIRVIPANN